MNIKLSFTFYLGAFIILCIIITILLLVSPHQNNFYNVKDKYPSLYYNLHKNERVIEEILNTTNMTRPDIQFVPNKIQLEWINYQNNEIKGDVKVLPLFYNNKYYENIKYFPNLMNSIRDQKILSLYFWKISPNSAILKQLYDNSDALRYTVSINAMSCNEEECSLWVNGEIKKMDFDKYALWNPAREFSLHNNTDNEILFLNIEIEK